MTTDYAHNGHAQQARLTKACFLMDALFAAGASSVDARALPEEGRRRAEAVAGTRKASDETWDLVFTIMEREEQAKARRTAMTADEAFARLPKAPSDEPW